jgi:3-phosphoshikimate 1-carboxyvinyltransferase
MKILPATAPAGRRAFQGRWRLPGDKSLSHRHILRAAIVPGSTRLLNLPDAQDVGRTLAAVEALGVRLQWEGPGRVLLDSPGCAGWTQPAAPLDCGNSGTTARLLMGLLAGSGLRVELVGDASLSRRPMERVAAPLRRMGARIECQDGGLPLCIEPSVLRGVEHELAVPSAQLKSALLLAGLFAEGETAVLEPEPSRDHTERMLGLNPDFVGFGSAGKPGVVRRWRVGAGDRPASPWNEVDLPGDPSSAAFLAAAALLLDGEAQFDGLLLNPYRSDWLAWLDECGARIELEEDPGEGFCGPAFCGSFCDPGEQCPIAEPVGRVRVALGSGIENGVLAGRRLPRLLDEIPALAVVAMGGEGPFELRDAAELRLKESDRIAGLCRLLRAFGGEVEERPDGFLLQPPARIRGGAFDPGGDHRLAMAAWVLALAAEGPSELAGADCVAVSFPEFSTRLAEGLGGR